MTKKQELYAMGLHETMDIKRSGGYHTPLWIVVRVIGGWVYRTTLSSSSGDSVHQIFVAEETEND